MSSSFSDGSSRLSFSGSTRMKTLPWISSMERWNGTRRMEWVYPTGALNYCCVFSVERCLLWLFPYSREQSAQAVCVEDKLNAAVDTWSCKTDQKKKKTKGITTAFCTSTSVSFPLCSHLCANKAVDKKQDPITRGFIWGDSVVIVTLPLFHLSFLFLFFFPPDNSFSRLQSTLSSPVRWWTCLLNWTRVSRSSRSWSVQIRRLWLTSCAGLQRSAFPSALRRNSPKRCQFDVKNILSFFLSLFFF